MNLSIIVPVYNCEKWIVNKIDEFLILTNQIKDSEIILVDDFSSDNTFNVISNYISGNSSIRLLKLDKNQGKGAAVMKGLNESSADYRIFTDCDLAYPISEVKKVYDELLSDKNIGMVIANRRDLNSICELNPKYFKHVYSREKSGATLNKFLKFMRLTLFDDTQAGLKGFRGNNIKKFGGISVYRFGFDIELLIIAVRQKIVIKQIPVRYIYHDDQSSVSVIRDGIRIIRDSIKIFINDKNHQYKHKQPLDKNN